MFGPGVQNEAEQSLTVLSKEHTDHIKHPFPTTRDNSIHGHHKMFNTKIRLIMFFFEARNGDALYSQ